MRKKIRVLIADNRQESRKSIIGIMEASSEYKLTGEAQNGFEVVDMAFNYQPDIIVMDVNLAGLNGFDAANQITQTFPYIGIILFGSAEQDAIIRKAMQNGAGDFLEVPFSSVKLLSSISSLYEIKQKQKKQLLNTPLTIPRRQPTIISVFSSKGGVGKTVVATNLAVSIKEQTREDVLLIDMDLQFGDIADLLGIDHKLSIIDLVADRGKIELTELDKYLATHHTGIKVLSAPLIPEQADLLTEKDLKAIMCLLSKRFDYIIVDLSPLFNEIVLSAIDISDHIIIITTMEIPTLKNVKAGLNILSKLNYPDEKLTIVVNRFRNNRELGLENIKKFLDVQQVLCINDNPELVISSINNGEPLVLTNRDHIISKQIFNLSRNMIDYKSPRESKKTSFLTRFFRKGAR